MRNEKINQGDQKEKEKRKRKLKKKEIGEKKEKRE